MNNSRPSLGASTAMVLLFALLWGYLRLQVFPDRPFPLTFVLPLLICVWSGRRWQLWGLAAVFGIMTFVKAGMLYPADTDADEYYPYVAATLFNIVLGAAVVHMILRLREGLENQNAIVSAQNAELEAQSEELSQQNEEIKAQAEELAQQNEEIEAQSEEVTRQNEDLLDLNHRLAGREDILQSLLQASRELESIPRVLEELCRRTLTVIGPPAGSVAVLEPKEEWLEVLSEARAENIPALPSQWPLADSIAAVVLSEKRTAYVSDLTRHAELAQPFGLQGQVRSVLATPVSLSGSTLGLMVVCSLEVTHWSEEQFRIIEWIAGQCGLILETLKSRRALAEHAKALEAANHAKDNFLAMLSHELRTPLTPILITSEMLEQDTRLPKEVRKSCQMIRRNVGIQSRLIDDLLDLTRISHGKIELNRQTLPITALLRETASIISTELLAKEQNLKLEVDALRDYGVIGDSTRLQQVFWNLLKNAIKFSERGSTISVLGRTENRCVFVEIRDPGCGICSKDLERIFLPFEQTQARIRNANDGGLGLGLAIAKAIVEKHGGRISAHSPGVGCGATFVVQLPAVFLSAKMTQQSVPSGTRRNGDQPPASILLVEDHGDTGHAIAELLRGFGYQVEHAETVAAAHRLFRQNDFSLLISDLGLPDGSGLELMRQFRKLRPHLPAICISGFGMERDVEQCRDAGFGAHLTKPVEPNRLKAVITSLLGHATLKMRVTEPADTV